MEVRLENRLQHERGRHLRHPVSDRRNPQRSSSSVRLRNVSTLDRARSIAACAQPVAELHKKSLDAVLLDIAERHRIDARRAAVRPHTPPCFPQDVTPADAVHQCMEAPTRLSLGRTPESASQLAHFGHRLASMGVIGAGLAGHALARPCPADVAPAGTLRSARVVRHGPPHYYGPLGLPLRHARFHRWLIRGALPRPGLRRRVSRVPLVSVHACCAPYPAETRYVYTSGLERIGHGLRRDMTGSALGLWI
jgi:hypothetical protein